jgi:hypothetical protein
MRHRDVGKIYLLASFFLLVLWAGWMAIMCARIFVSAFDTLGKTQPDRAALALAAIGLLAMAILQSLRLLFPLRGLFHGERLKGWFDYSEHPDGYPAKALLELLGVSDRSILDLPVEQLCGQIGAAMEAALANPFVRGRLLRAILGTHNEDLEELIARSQQSHNRPPFSDPSPEQERLEQLRNLVSYQIQRRIDSFQIATAAAWKRWLRIAAVYISGILGVLATVSINSVNLSLMMSLTVWASLALAFVLAGLVGGFLAALKSRTFVLKSRTMFTANFVRDLKAKVATMGDGGRGCLGRSAAPGNRDSSFNRAPQTQRREYRRSNLSIVIEPQHSLQTPATVRAQRQATARVSICGSRFWLL